MKQKIIAFLLSFSLLFSCVAMGPGAFPRVFAAKSLEEIQQRQQETMEEIADAEASRQEAEENVSSLQNEQQQIQTNYNSLYSKLSSINKKIEEADASIVSTQSEIASLEAELNEAKEMEQGQYEAMKARMAYFYENSHEMNLFLILLSSGSFTEFLNRATAMERVMSYDRELLNSYQELQTTILQKSEKLSAKNEELLAYQDELSASQDEMDALLTGTSAALTAKQGEVGDAQEELEAYEEQLSKLKKRMKSLEAQAAEAQAAAARALAEELARAQEDGTVEDTSGAIAATASDVQILAATIQAEADNQSYEGKLAVGSVIMNRVKSSKFPNTIYGVVSQERQFASYTSGMVDAILQKGPNDSCVSVANEVIGGKRNGNWLFFMTKAAADNFGIVEYTQIGDHVFFLVWKTYEKSATDTTTDTSSGASSAVSDVTAQMEALTGGGGGTDSADTGTDEEEELGYYDEDGMWILY